MLIMLTLCVSIDYADVQRCNSTVEMMTSSKSVVDGIGIITIVGKPSCTECMRNGIPYEWYEMSYVNYCPNCRRYGTLGNKHKRNSRHEQEITCFNCDSDFCIHCGKEKYSWSDVHLIKVES